MDQGPKQDAGQLAAALCEWLDRTAAARTTDEPAVLVRDLSHTFGEGEKATRVLFDINLSVRPGEIVIMTGPSGCGKTTLLTLMGGLRRLWEGVPDTCDLRIYGKSLRNLSDAGLVEVRRDIGFIFQRHNLIESLTALQNVYMSQELREAPSAEMKARAVALLERLGLGHRVNFKPASLSGGQRQRVAVARALVNRPRLVLADEPTAALDAKSTQDVMALLHELAQEGSTIFIVTHDAKIIDKADRIVDMDKGRIAANVLVHERKFIREALRTCPPFVVLDQKELLEIVDQMAVDGKPPEEQARILKKFQAGEEIVSQGDAVGPDSLFYLIRRGKVAVLRDGVTVVEMEAGRYFGDVSLVFGGPRNATVRAVESTETYTLGQETFDKVKDAAARYVRRIREAYNF